MVLGMCDPEQDAMHAHVNNVMMTNIRSYFNHGLYKKKAVLFHKAYIYIYIYMRLITKVDGYVALK
jgi:hypothetical protein